MRTNPRFRGSSSQDGTGCDLIVGFAYTDFLQKFIASKTKAALDGGLGVILCVGETLEVSFPLILSTDPFHTSKLLLTVSHKNQQREAEKTIPVVTHQLNAVADLTKDFSKIVIAYEPVWYGSLFSLSPSILVPNTRQYTSHPSSLPHSCPTPFNPTFNYF